LNANIPLLNFATKCEPYLRVKKGRKKKLKKLKKNAKSDNELSASIPTPTALHFSYAAPLPYALTIHFIKVTANESFYIAIKYEITPVCLVIWLFFIWAAINVTNSYKICEISGKT
jgi:hypothetical protein